MAGTIIRNGGKLLVMPQSPSHTMRDSRSTSRDRNYSDRKKEIENENDRYEDEENELEGDGIVTLCVIDTKTGSPLDNATVRCGKYNIDHRTDPDGEMEIVFQEDDPDEITITVDKGWTYAAQSVRVRRDQDTIKIELERIHAGKAITMTLLIFAGIGAVLALIFFGNWDITGNMPAPIDLQSFKGTMTSLTDIQGIVSVGLLVILLMAILDRSAAGEYKDLIFFGIAVALYASFSISPLTTTTEKILAFLLPLALVYAAVFLGKFDATIGGAYWIGIAAAGYYFGTFGIAGKLLGIDKGNIYHLSALPATFTAGGDIFFTLATIFFLLVGGMHFLVDMLDLSKKKTERKPRWGSFIFSGAVVTIYITLRVASPYLAEKGMALAPVWCFAIAGLLGVVIGELLRKYSAKVHTADQNYSESFFGRASLETKWDSVNFATLLIVMSAMFFGVY